MSPLWIVPATTLLLAAAFVLPTQALAQSQPYEPIPVPANDLVLDDFADEQPSAYGRWSLSTDRVMGGLSDGWASLEMVDGRPAMRMTGRVRLENNGGFVQNTLRMNAEMDASAYEGVRLGVRTEKPGAYYLFVRTSSNWMPWSYYSAPIEVDGTWTELSVPWSAFEAQSAARAFDPSRIRSISVVAYGQAMDADIAVDGIGLYAAGSEREPAPVLPGGPSIDGMIASGR